MSLIEKKDDLLDSADNTQADPIPVGSGTQKPILMSIEKNDDDKKSDLKKDLKQDPKICHFYKNGKCRHHTECQFSHLSICKKFRANGSIKFNGKGCNGKCKLFHPNVCRD